MRSALVLAALAVAGCGGSGTVDAGTPDAGLDATAPDLGTDAADLGSDTGPADLGLDAGVDAGPPPECGMLRRAHVVPAGALIAPSAALAPAGDDRIFVVDRIAGKVRIVDATGALVMAPFLDVSASIDISGFEAGLLALAFDSDWPTTTRVYATYTTASTLRLVRFDVPSATAAAVDASSVTTLLELPTVEHHDLAGWLEFGPDGTLYVGIGDNSQETLPQDRASLIGKLLRLDVHASGVPYAAPATNPFVGMTGDAPEVFAYGLRMPYRFAFDPMNGDLYIGEIGDAMFEELDVLPHGDPGGENFGWPVLEGAACHTPPTACPTAGFTAAAYTYDHMGGHAAIVGGDVYRGSALASCWQGRWFFADYQAGWVGSLRWSAAGGATGVERYDDLAGGFLVSLGKDGHGELLVVMGSGAVDRLVPGP